MNAQIGQAENTRRFQCVQKCVINHGGVRSGGRGGGGRETEFIGLASTRPRVPSPESNLRILNYQGRKSELCVLGIEKQLVHFQDAAGLTAVNTARLTNCYLVFVSGGSDLFA